jgi:excisionase family DNA binding protein
MTLAALEQAVQAASLTDLPGVLGRLERVKAIGWGRMLAGPENGPGAGELLTVPDVAQRLKVSEYRAYELCRQGVLKSVRLGKSVRVTPAAVADYLARHGA